MWGVFPHINQFANSPDTKWVSYNLIMTPATPNQLQIHKFRGQFHKTTPTSDTSPKYWVPK